MRGLVDTIYMWILVFFYCIKYTWIEEWNGGDGVEDRLEDRLEK